MKTQNARKTPPAALSFRFPPQGGGLRGSSAFTLVELIIVITILAILATIGFMSFQSYTMDARDANRITTIKSAQDGLEIYKTKKTTYPTPDNPTTLTGGNTTIVQGILGKTVGDSIKLIGDIKDPKTSAYYVYSVSGNGDYYQIASDLENTVSYNTPVNTTYAEGTKALVKGNYTFDPSLPSLITVSGSVNTSSGIFDPNVCFVIDGGANLVTSTSTTCTQKKNMSLKDFDSALVGYWDMESKTTTGLLMDLSGNGNDGTGSGGVVIGGTLGKVGNATLFNSGSKQYFSVLDKNILDLNNKFTFSTIVNINDINVLFGGDFDILSKNKGSGGSIFEPYRFTLGKVAGGEFYSRTTNFIINGFIYQKSNTGYINQTSLGSSISLVESGSYIPYIYERDVYYYSFNNINNFIITSTYDNGLYSSYINGIKINSIFFKNKNIWNSNGDLLIGSRSGTRNYFNGIIDDVKIYNRALSDSEIAQQARIAGF